MDPKTEQSTTTPERQRASTPSRGGSTSPPAGGASLQLRQAMGGRPLSEQAALLEPPGPFAIGGAVQAKGEPTGPDVHAHASAGVAGSGGSLPHLDRIQQSFGGHDVSGVRAHTGGRAAEASDAIGASAYATGNDVAFKSGPDLHTAAHEAAHVVQQRQGVSLDGGVGRSGDGYERHADKVADAVVAGKSAEGLLGPSDGARSPTGVQRQVQREGPAPDSELGQKATERGATLEEMTTLDNKKGYHATEGSMARDPDFEANAQKFEDRLGKKAVNDPVATTAAATLAGYVRELIHKWATALGEASEKAEVTQARFEQKLPGLVGTGDKGVAGAVGTKVTAIEAAIKSGNLREQMTVLFNFGRTFGAELVTAKGTNPEGVDDFISSLDLKSVKLQQQLERLGGKNRYLVSDSTTGEVGAQKGTRGQKGTDAKEWDSVRSVGEAGKQGVDLSSREVETMELDPKALQTEVLTWSEGNRKWLINEADTWVQKAREASLPVKAGPSGTTDRIMQLRDMLGVSSPIATRAACIGYLLPINAHSLIEILEAASQYACPKPTYGPGVYASIEPFQGLELLAPSRAFWTTVTAK